MLASLRGKAVLPGVGGAATQRQQQQQQQESVQQESGVEPVGRGGRLHITTIAVLMASYQRAAPHSVVVVCAELHSSFNSSLPRTAPAARSGQAAPTCSALYPLPSAPACRSIGGVGARAQPAGGPAAGLVVRRQAPPVGRRVPAAQGPVRQGALPHAERVRPRVRAREPARVRGHRCLPRAAGCLHLGMLRSAARPQWGSRAAGAKRWVHVHTAAGDIPDEWIRDSSVQLGVNLPRMVQHPALRQVGECAAAVGGGGAGGWMPHPSHGPGKPRLAGWLAGRCLSRGRWRQPADPTAAFPPPHQVPCHARCR